MTFFQKILSDNRLPFLLLTLGAVVWLVCLQLFQDGMFMDGTQYAAVARNMAKGIGTFWFPVFSENFVAGLNSFHEHPPLVYYLQSFFFRIFGLHNIYPERIYDLTMLLLTAFFMALIWKKIFAYNSAVAKHYWLPVFFWVIIPVVFWSFTNNIHEITMGMFTTAAIYFFMVSVASTSAVSMAAFIIGIACVAAAFLSKGVPGLFPLAFFGIHFISFRKNTFRHTIIATIIALAVLGIIALIILLIPEAKQSLHIWFYDRMMHRIANNPVAGNHFHILKGLFTEQLPPIIIGMVAWGLFRFYKVENRYNGRVFIFFMLTALSASLPLMLTLVQRDFYFVPALPFFAMAWAALVVKGISVVAEKFQQLKMWRATVILLLIMVISGILATYIKSGNIKRHHAQLADVYKLKEMLANEATVCVPAKIMWHDWSFRCYMMRYNDIAFANADSCTYYIEFKNGAVSSRYTLLQSLQKYEVYKHE
jgi:4-amino-4-deoxy-L-arabinose transferase-like glycosyltransferase